MVGRQESRLYGGHVARASPSKCCRSQCDNPVGSGSKQSMQRRIRGAALDVLDQEPLKEPRSLPVRRSSVPAGRKAILFTRWRMSCCPLTAQTTPPTGWTTRCDSFWSNWKDSGVERGFLMSWTKHWDTEETLRSIDQQAPRSEERKSRTDCRASASFLYTDWDFGSRPSHEPRLPMSQNPLLFCGFSGFLNLAGFD
jgi:hypothetical protein